MTIKSQKKIIIYLSLIIILAILLKLQNLSAIYVFITSLYNKFGENDLFAFWAGTHLFLKGMNPYSLQNIFNYQLLFFKTIDNNLVFLNPPWALPFFILFFMPSFQTVKISWFIINLILLWATNYFLIKTITDKQINLTSHIIIFFVTLACPVSILHLWLGQASLFVYFSFTLSLYFFKNKQNKLAIISLTGVLIKPHLLYLPLLVLFYNLIKEKKIKIILIFITTFVILATLPLFWQPNIYHYWLNIDFSIQHYYTPVFANIIRSYLKEYFNESLFFINPLTATLAGAITLIWTVKKNITLKWEDNLPYILCASLFFNIYAWEYDFIILTSIYTITLLYYFQHKRGGGSLFYLFCIIYLSSSIIVILPLVNQSTLKIPLPLVMCIAWFLFKKHIKEIK